MDSQSLAAACMVAIAILTPFVSFFSRKEVREDIKRAYNKWRRNRAKAKRYRNGI
jgi:hypothetical protein